MDVARASWVIDLHSKTNTEDKPVVLRNQISTVIRLESSHYKQMLQ